MGQQIGTGEREDRPRLDWTREKKVHAQASCLWSGKVAGTRRVVRSAVIARTMCCTVLSWAVRCDPPKPVTSVRD